MADLEEKMVSTILSKEFQTQIAEELKILDFEKDMYQNLSIQHRYFQMLIECKKDLIRVKEILDSKYQELLHYYKFEYDYTLSNQKEVDTYIFNNEKYKKINKVYQLKKLEEEVLLETVKLFQTRAFSFKEINKFHELEKR